jgi:hypothetical protein
MTGVNVTTEFLDFSIRFLNGCDDVDQRRADELFSSIQLSWILGGRRSARLAQASNYDGVLRQVHLGKEPNVGRDVVRRTH